MTVGPTLELPVPDLGGLPDLDASWSRVVAVTDGSGVTHQWHVLERSVPEGMPTVATMLCVHGNPTWSFLWRRFLAAAPAGWRVVAVDQLGMGYSERTAEPRTLPQRVDDLGDLSAALGITGPVVTVGHDWGGIISSGWALAHREQLRGVVLTNTAVHLAEGDAGPGLIRLAQTPLLRDPLCVRTPAFLRGASALSRPSLPAAARRGLERPYGRAAERTAIGDFVADVPFGHEHPSRPALDAIADGLSGLTDVPVLLMWGPRDPVFAERYLEDLLQRMPHADVQRYPRASHLVTEDAPQTAADAWRWVTTRTGPDATPQELRPAESDEAPWNRLLEHAGDPTTAVVELHGRRGAEGERRTVTFAELNARIRNLGAGLTASGVQPGDRVALLVPPGIDLTVAVYACWQAGAAIVVADAGLGLRGMAHALRSAAPQHVIGIPKALVAMAALRVPGRRIVVGGSAAAARAFGWTADVAGLEELGAGLDLAALPAGDAEGAVLFTSGATGPAKGVVYRLSQLRAQIDHIAAVLRLGPEDRLVAAFAPFALYAPAIGIGAAVPDMDVTAPHTLTATALADAVAAIDATSVFASPAALRNVVATADALTNQHRAALAGVRTVLSAGAPVPVTLLRQVQQVLPAAELHTPYGMTEVLPATDISLAGIEAAGAGNGVCVGLPLAGVRLTLSPLDALGRADGELTDEPGVTGEVLIAAAHRKERYDRLWATEQQSSRNPGWHRSGDVGHLDDEGRLWVEGRLVHVVTTADGPVTPVGVEQSLELLDEVSAAAAVGVGPAGTQQVVAVVVPSAGVAARSQLAPADLAAAVRAASPVPLAAVLVTDALPVDIRHASKVDRAKVARWAAHVLAGERAGRLARRRR